MSRKHAATLPPPAPTRAAGPGRPKDLGKRASILEAAKRLFIEQGYLGVSMDQIAAAAGVSKLTVYSHFGDKETCLRRPSPPSAAKPCRTTCSPVRPTARCTSSCARSATASSP